MSTSQRTQPEPPHDADRQAWGTLAEVMGAAIRERERGRRVDAVLLLESALLIAARVLAKGGAQ